MAGDSNIEWTDSTWNPIVGCSIVSPGCTNCYAMKMAARLEAINRAGGTDDNGYRVRPAPGSKTLDHYEGTTRKVSGTAVWTGKIALAPDHILLQPLHWKKPRRVFVNSMGDLFHEDAPDEWLDKMFAVMALCPQHTFQVLTKRAERMREYCSRRPGDGVIDAIASFTGFDTQPSKSLEYLVGQALDAVNAVAGWPLPNVWLGVSCERQQEADERIQHLLQTPAAIRFVSAEPLLGPIDFVRSWRVGADSSLERTFAALDWVIVGGESGSKARPMHPDWARSIRDQCATAGVAFFFKQWGGWVPHTPVAGGDLGGDVRAGRVRIVHPTGQSDVEVSVATGGRSTIPGSRYMERVGKKAAGRLLGGREYNEFPVTDSSASQSGLSLHESKQNSRAAQP